MFILCRLEFTTFMSMHLRLEKNSFFIYERDLSRRLIDASTGNRGHVCGINRVERAIFRIYRGEVFRTTSTQQQETLTFYEKLHQHI